MQTKKLLSVILAVVMVLGMLPATVFAEDATVTVTEIATVEDLKNFAAAVNAGDTFAGKTVRLTADIDLAGIQWQPIGGDSVYFAGEFDGNGKTISNLTNTEDVARKGLFGLVEKCYIHDLTLKNVKFSGNTTGARIGALAGNLQYYNVIENITIDGLDYDINDTNGLIGGLAGYVWTSYVKNCVVKNADMNISSTNDSSVGVMIAYGRGVSDARTNFPYADKIAEADYQGDSVWNYCDSKVEGAVVNLSGTVTFGGFLGTDTYNSWRNYAHNNTVTGLNVTCAEGDGVYTVGGFMGGQYGGYDPAALYNNSVAGSITSTGTNTASTFGGFIGYKGGRPGGVTGCFANVDINVAAGDVGGFVGETQQYFAHAYTFEECEATGDISTANGTAGGFIANVQHGGDGSSLNVTITNSSASGTVNGTTEGGLVGVVNDNKNGTPTGGTVTLANNTVTATDSMGEDLDEVGSDPSGLIPIYVAQVGETCYPSIQAAIDAATNGTTAHIDLLGNTTETGIKIPAGKQIVLDLSNYTLTGDIYSEGRLSVINGTIISDTFTSAIESYGAKAELLANNVTVTSQRHALRIEGGLAIIGGGTFTTVGRAGQTETVHALNAGGAYDTVVAINGGSFYGLGANAENPDSSAAINAQDKATVRINANTGVFSGGQNDTLAISGTGAIVITDEAIGSTYDQDPSAYLTEDCIAVEENGVWTVAAAAAPALDMEVPTEYLSKDESFTITVKNAGRDMYGLMYNLDYDDTLFTLVSGEVNFDNATLGTMNAIAAGDIVATYTFTYIGKDEATAPFTADFTLTDISATTTPVADGNAKNLSDVTKSVNLKGVFDNTYVTAVTGAVYNGNEITSATENNLPAGAEITYTVENESSGTIPAFTDAGTYTVTYTITCENYEDYTGSYEFTIDKLAVTVTPDDNSKTFGDTDPVLTGKVTCTNDGTEITDEAILTALGITYSREEGEAVGTYTISATGTADTKNYTVTTAIGTFTINASELMIAKMDNYADGKTLYLVCTNDNVAVKFGNYWLYEMTDIKSASAYADVANYAHVYGWVALDDTELTVADFTAVAYEDVETLTHSNDVNSDGTFDYADRVCVGAVYNGNSAYFTEKYMHILLGADVNMDGRVTVSDAPSIQSTSSN